MLASHHSWSSSCTSRYGRDGVLLALTWHVCTRWTGYHISCTGSCACPVAGMPACSTSTGCASGRSVSTIWCRIKQEFPFHFDVRTGQGRQVRGRRNPMLARMRVLALQRVLAHHLRMRAVKIHISGVQPTLVALPWSKAQAGSRLHTERPAGRCPLHRTGTVEGSAPDDRQGPTEVTGKGADEGAL